MIIRKLIPQIINCFNEHMYTSNLCLNRYGRKFSAATSTKMERIIIPYGMQVGLTSTLKKPSGEISFLKKLIGKITTVWMIIRKLIPQIINCFDEHMYTSNLCLNRHGRKFSVATSIKMERIIIPYGMKVSLTSTLKKPSREISFLKKLCRKITTV